MSFNAGFAAGVAFGRKKYEGGGSGGTGTFTALIDDDAGGIDIVLGTTSTVEEVTTTTYDTYDYEYVTKNITKTMTLGNTSKAITVKSIEKLKNGAGRIIATAHYTDNVGNIDYYTLSGDKKLWTTEGYLNE